MARKKKQSTLMVILTLVVGVAVWYIKNKDTLGDGGKVVLDDSGKVVFDTSGLTELKVTTSEFKVFEDCSLADHRNNDGDSFFVNHPEGKDEIRLYFVDTAESRLHSKNGKRIAEQGEYFNALSQEDTVSVGKKGKAITLGLLKDVKFKMITKWEPVTSYPDETRKHAYIIIEQAGKEYYLHEILAKTGLVRTKTRGTSLPDGTDFYTQRDKVRSLEAQSKRNKKGAWGM